MGLSVRLVSTGGIGAFLGLLTVGHIHPQIRSLSGHDYFNSFTVFISELYWYR